MLSGEAARQQFPLAALWLAVIAEAVLVTGAMMTSTQPFGWSWTAAGVGAAGILAYWMLFQALRTGPVGPSVAVSALYPAVTVALGVLVLREQLTWRGLVGTAMAVGAAVLLAGA